MSIIKENDIKFSNLKTAEDYDFLKKIITKTKIHMINESLYYYRHNETSIFNRNFKETFKNSVQISSAYHVEITGSEIPNFYKFLTYFYTEDDEPEIEDIVRIHSFLQDVAEKFKEFYKWTDEQYEKVKQDILRIIERYSVYKYLAQKYGKIGTNFEAEKGKKQSSITRLIIKGKAHLKKYGFKTTVSKVLTKVKGKIWKKA